MFVSLVLMAATNFFRSGSPDPKQDPQDAHTLEKLTFSNTIATSSRTGSHSKCVDPFAIIRRPRSAFATRDFQFPLRFPFLSLRELVECFTRPFNSTSKALGQKLWHFHTSSLLLRVLC
ncbi:hypothetical protein C6341_g13726 [Phytophthora cactorum]|nr:hypothetical protein C6341_g13726 [Phytophthora cactorum]